MPNNQDDLNRKLNYLNETKQEIKRSLKAKGQPVNDNTTFREYANLVNNITTGTDTDDADATPNDILSPKTAYVKGQKITGDIMPTYEQVASGDFITRSCNLSKLTDRTKTQGFAISPDGKVIVYCSDCIFYFYVYNEETQEFEYKGEKSHKSSSSTGFNSSDKVGITVSSLGIFNNPTLLMYSYFYELSNYSRATYIWLFDISSKEFTSISLTIATNSPCRFLIHNDETVYVLHFKSGSSYSRTLTLDEIIKNETSYSYSQLFQVFSSNNGPSLSEMSLFDFINNNTILYYYKSGASMKTCIQCFDNVGNKSSYNLIEDTVFIPNPSMNYVCQDGIIKHLVYNMSTGEYNTSDLETLINIDNFDESIFNPNCKFYKWLADDIIVVGAQRLTYNEIQNVYEFRIYKINYEDYSIELIDTFTTENMAQFNTATNHYYGTPYYFNQLIDLFNQGSYLSLNSYNGAISHILTTTPSENLISFTRNGINYIDTSKALTDSSKVLQDYIFYANNAKNMGTMPNNGELNYTPSDIAQIIPEGYTSGGTIKAIDVTQTQYYEECLELSNQILGN